MKNRKKASLFRAVIITLSCISVQSHAAFYDLYAGMLKRQGEQLVLSKCSAASADFILKFESEQLKIQLPDLAVNDQVQIRVKGKAREENGQYYLLVHEVAGVKVGTSCKLLDFFN